MAFYKQLTSWDTAPYQPKQWFTDLDAVILATDYFDRTGAKKNIEFPPLGAIREENSFMGSGIYQNVLVSGKATFMWVWNNSGGNIAQGEFMVRRPNQAITNFDSGSVSSGTKAGVFTANKEVGGLLWLLDDAGAAGAAPEGSFGQIWKNDANTINFQPDFPAIIAVNDDGVIIYHDHITRGGSGATMADFRGVAPAVGGLPDGYMGWAVIKADKVAVKGVVAGTTIAASKAIIGAANGLFTNSSTSADNVILGMALAQLTTDTVSRLFLANIGYNPHWQTST